MEAHTVAAGGATDVGCTPLAAGARVPDPTVEAVAGVGVAEGGRGRSPIVARAGHTRPRLAITPVADRTLLTRQPCKQSPVLL